MAVSSAAQPQRMQLTGRLRPNVYVGSLWPSSDKPARRVVVKIGRPPLKQHVDGETALDRLEEWRVARRLKALGAHENLVTFYDAYVHENSAYLVMEHCTHGDLLQFLLAQPGHRLSQPHALNVFLQIARGLAALHAQNIAHRDLSLDNIFLSDTGQCKIGDFGLATTSADRRVRQCVGKNEYAAPEVVQGELYDPKVADLWSLGVLLFMLLTGLSFVPVGRPESPEFRAVQAIGCRGLLRVWQMDTLFSYATVDLLCKLLEIDSAKRCQSVHQVLDHPAMIATAARKSRCP